MVTFKENRAVVAGAAIYANDMSRCRWLGPQLQPLYPNTTTIFQISPEDDSPFKFENNTLMSNTSTISGTVSSETLATDPSIITARSFKDVSYGEELSLYLSSMDQFENFREAVWSLDAPGKMEEVTVRSGCLNLLHLFSFSVWAPSPAI